MSSFIFAHAELANFTFSIFDAATQKGEFPVVETHVRVVCRGVVDGHSTPCAPRCTRPTFALGPTPEAWANIRLPPELRPDEPHKRHGCRVHRIDDNWEQERSERRFHTHDVHTKVALEATENRTE